MECGTYVTCHRPIQRARDSFCVSELRFPPYVFLDKDEYVRIVGEDLKIHCTTHNPNFNYIVTWKHPSTMVC